MTMLTSDALRSGLSRIASHLPAVADELNSADGILGDGDLGITMTKGARELQAVVDDLPEDLGAAFLACAVAFTKGGGSSYGTLVATGLMAAARDVKGVHEVPWAQVAELLDAAIDAMMKRGGASLGDKTVLDAMAAAAGAIRGLSDPDEQVRATLEAIEGHARRVPRTRESHRARPCPR